MDQITHTQKIGHSQKPCSQVNKTELTSLTGVSSGRSIKAALGRLDPSKLVFIDETWAKTNMTPTHGWSMKGKPLIAKAPGDHWRGSLDDHDLRRSPQA